MALVSEAGFERDGALRVSSAQQFLGARDAPLDDVLMYWNPHAPLEKDAEMGRAGASDMRETSERKISCEVGLDAVEDGRELLGRKPPYARRSSGRAMPHEELDGEREAQRLSIEPIGELACALFGGESPGNVLETWITHPALERQLEPRIEAEFFRGAPNQGLRNAQIDDIAWIVLGAKVRGSARENENLAARGQRCGRASRAAHSGRGPSVHADQMIARRSIGHVAARHPSDGDLHRGTRCSAHLEQSSSRAVSLPIAEPSKH